MKARGTMRFRELINRARAFFLGARADRDSLDEFAFHVDMETEKNIRAGMAPEEARRRAKLAFGNVQSARERTRDARGARLAEDALRDLTHGFRQLMRRPGFTIVTVLTIALGIGAMTAIWSVVDGVLLRPAPVEDLDRLTMIWQTDRASSTTREPSSWPDFVDVVAQSRSFAEIAAFAGVERGFRSETGDMERVAALTVTERYFDLVGVAPRHGRGFSAAETRVGGPAVVMLGEAFWRRQFAADPGVLGETLVLDDAPYEIVGVMPRDAGFGLDQIHAQAAYHGAFTVGAPIDVWLPTQADAEQYPRHTHPFLVLGRLNPGVTVDSAQREATSIATQLEETYPESNTDRGMFVEPLESVVFAGVRPVLWVLAGAVSFLLLVSFVNVTNLLLTRQATRRREVAVRTALGAGTGRIARQLLVENALLTAIGAGLGVVLAFGILRVLLRLAPNDIPRLAEVGIDSRVLVVTLLVSTAGALLFALVPTLETRRVDMLQTIQGSGRAAADGRRQRRLRQLLVVAELALSVALVIAAGLLVRSLWTVLAVDPGFRADGVLKAEYQLPTSRYPRDFSRWPNLHEIHGFNERLLAEVERLPGVDAAALAGSHPLDRGFTNSFQVVGREDESRGWPEISLRMVSPGYFETLAIEVIDGRTLEARDRTDTDAVAVINRAAAERLFENRVAIGQSISFWGTERRIVGVIENERIHGLTESVPIAAYVPLTQVPSNDSVLLVRASEGDPMRLANDLKTAIASVDPGLAVHGVERLRDTLAGTFSERRFAMLVLVVMAGITLLLALLGVHGVLSYATAQRTREIGIRSALGATRIEVTGLVVRHGLLMATAGIAIGLGLAVIGSRFLTGLLYGVAELDPTTYVAVPVILLLAAAFACWHPARRAAKVDPVEVLRAE